MVYKFTAPLFIKSAAKNSDYPQLVDAKGRTLPEIAVVGRSNVGKSSLLNHLFKTKNLVKTSSTPGKTQLLNFFTLNAELSFVDLPGYGFAKVSKDQKSHWAEMIQQYLDSRDSLHLILFLQDIRRLPREEDLQLLEWIIHAQKAMILVLTKVDKVTLNERNSQTKKIIETLNCEPIHYVHFSTLKNEGREPLIHLIQQAFKDEF